MTLTSSTPYDSLLDALERLDGEDRWRFFASAKARGLLPRWSRGEYYRARNDEIVRLSQRGLTARQIGNLPSIDMSRDAVLMVLRRRRKRADIGELSSPQIALRTASLR